MTTKRWILGLVLVCLALAGHVAFWYLPRARPASPQADSPVARLLANQDFPVALWVPYPHQNLAYLRRLSGIEPVTLEAVTRLAGLPAPIVPTFGPLELPPSSEIAIASDEVGERFVLYAQVYPLFAAFAKLAGGLAGNAWLEGGEVSIGDRRAEIAWHGNLWTIAPPGFAEPADDPVPPSASAPALGLIRMRQAIDPLPAGLYRLSADDAGLEITSGRQSAITEVPRFAVSGLESLKLFLLIYSGRNEALAEPARALAVFDQVEEQAMELPRMAALHEPGAERWALPLEGLHEPRIATVDGWEIAALQAESLELAGRVAPALTALGNAGLGWGLWLDLRGGLAEVERIAQAIDEMPLVPRHRIERWRDARQVLAPLARRYAGLSLLIFEEPRAMRLRLAAAPRDSP